MSKRYRLFIAIIVFVFATLALPTPLYAQNCQVLARQALILLNQASASLRANDLATAKVLVDSAKVIMQPCVDTGFCNGISELIVLLDRVNAQSAVTTTSTLVNAGVTLLRACPGVLALPTRSASVTPVTTGNITFRATVIGITLSYPGTWRGKPVELTKTQTPLVVLGNSAVGVVAATLGSSVGLKTGELGMSIGVTSVTRATTARSIAVALAIRLRGQGYTIGDVQTTVVSGKTIAYADLKKGTLTARFAYVNLTDTTLASILVYGLPTDMDSVFAQAAPVIASIRLAS